MTTTASTVLGSALIGVVLNVLLQGVFGLQCCHYYNITSTNDPLWMKTMVGILCFAETLGTAFDIAWLYDTFIKHFMDPSALTTANWMFATDPAMVGIVAFMVQNFFAWRIQILTHNQWIVWFVRLTSLGSIFGGLGTAIAIHFVPNFLEFHRFEMIMIIWLGSSVICDSTIAVVLSSYLLRHRTGIPGTDQLIHKVTMLTMANGLLVTIVAMANLIAFFTTPSGLYLVFNFPLAKLYSNSLMSTLNKRPASRHTTATAITLPTTQYTNPSRPTLRSSAPMVFVHVESHEMVDNAEKKPNDPEWSATSGTTRAEKEPNKYVGSTMV